MTENNSVASILPIPLESNYENTVANAYFLFEIESIAWEESKNNGNGA